MTAIPFNGDNGIAPSLPHGDNGVSTGDNPSNVGRETRTGETRTTNINIKHSRPHDRPPIDRNTWTPPRPPEVGEGAGGGRGVRAPPRHAQSRSGRRTAANNQTPRTVAPRPTVGNPTLGIGPLGAEQSPAPGGTWGDQPRMTAKLFEIAPHHSLRLHIARSLCSLCSLW